MFLLSKNASSSVRISHLPPKGIPNHCNEFNDRYLDSYGSAETRSVAPQFGMEGYHHL